MRHISLREANQRLSACIAEVEQGEHFVVERRGIPVAQIIPFPTSGASADREKKLKRLLEMLDRGLPLGGEKFPSRDELHER
ncbi:type II toxin-antitoxin system Phd/YefM family antitoxin [Terriglobus sp. RCC_193]|uniref:type II toxin-antitoxin system Phd/YefM family antitoxin n=1 Tax=Terriglobus sp. RCC_193 TaxID=3239218 RepID=UPI0035259C8F